MIRRPPRSTRTDTLFPYTTLCRSGLRGAAARDEVPAEPAQIAGQLDDAGLVVDGDEGPHGVGASFVRMVGSVKTARMVSGYRRRSTALMRSCSDDSSS